VARLHPAVTHVEAACRSNMLKATSWTTGQQVACCCSRLVASTSCWCGWAFRERWNIQRYRPI